MLKKNNLTSQDILISNFNNYRSFMLASDLEKSEFLISPNFSHPNAQKSVLVKYRHNGIKIAANAVLAVSKPINPNQPINERIFNWIIQACGYALRINDQRNSESFFQQSLILYLNWLKDFPFVCELELKENYIRVLMLHLSQVFVNPSFNDVVTYIFINKIRSAFISSKQPFLNETWSVILKVLFYGNSELLKLKNLQVEDSTKMEFAKTTLDILYKCRIYPDDSFWSQFDNQLKELFQFPIFCTAWLSKFSELYMLRLKKQNDIHTTDEQLNYLNFIIQFYKKKVDTEFNETGKQEAFTTIVYTLSSFTKENTSILHKKWKIDEIKEMILPWFSLNVDWRRDEKMNVTHPLFLLIKMGEGQLYNQKDDQLDSIASTIVKKALSPEIKNDLYWFFPQYSYLFLVKNPKLLDEIKDDFIKYTKEFKNSEFSNDVELNTCICLILMLFIEWYKNDPKIVDSLSQFFVTKTDNFSILLVSFVCLLFIKNSELFWSTYNSFLTNHKFDDVTDVFSLISFLSPHLNGPDFVNNLSINSNLWTFLYAPISNEFRERLILSLFFLSEGSDYFVVNPEDGATLIQYFIIKSNDVKTFPAFSNFFKMTRLSILCGGALNANQPLTENNDQTTSMKSLESFMTQSYIISVLDNNHLIIRHGLGSTIFEVDDSDSLFTNEDDDIEDYTPPTIENDDIFSEASSAYVSKCEPASELLEAVEKMDSLFLSNSDFVPYSPPKKRTNASAAHAFLCDSGFISSSSEKNIRRIPFSTMKNTVEAKIDLIEPTPKIKIPIIQVDEKSEIFSGNSEALQKLVQVDLQKVQTKVYKLEFVYSDNIMNLISMVEKYGFCILFNETGLSLNHSCKDIKTNVIISLIPDNDYYIVDLMFSKNFDSLSPTAKRKLFGDHNFDDISFIIPNENLANFISLAAVIFYSSTPLSNENDENRISLPSTSPSVSASTSANEDQNTNNSSELDNHQSDTLISSLSSNSSTNFIKNEESFDEQFLGPELFVSGFKKRIIAISNEFEKTNQGKMPLLIEITQES